MVTLRIRSSPGTTFLLNFASLIPPTINLEKPDPELTLDYVPNEGRKADITYTMSNSLGFGGHNGTLIIKKFED